MFTSRKHWNRNNSLRLAGLSSPQIFLDTFPPAQMFPCWRLFLLSLLGLWMGIFLCKVMIWSGMSPHLFRARPLEGLVFRMIGPYGHHHWVITTPDDHNGPEFMIWLANGFDETLVTKTIFHFLYSTTLFLFIQQYMLRKCIHTSIYIHIHPYTSEEFFPNFPPPRAPASHWRIQRFGGGLSTPPGLSFSPPKAKESSQESQECEAREFSCGKLWFFDFLEKYPWFFNLIKYF